MLHIRRTLLAGTVLALAASSQDSGPWRLDDVLGTPDWLTFGGSIELRYEGLEGQYRNNPRLDESDHLAFQRTLLRGDVELESFGGTVELIDVRHYGGGVGSQLNTRHVDTLDFLQAFGAFSFGRHSVRVGRWTLDLGSRRQVARQIFRPTINSYAGVGWDWHGDSTKTHVFWSMPTKRRPNDFNSVRNNEIELNDEDLDLQLFGAFLANEVDDRTTLELYSYGVLESAPGSRMRDVAIPGFRVIKRSAAGELDYEWETIVQLGQTKLSPSGPTLDHRAWHQVAAIGYTFEDEWATRVRLGFEYASGDEDPNDGENNRFDPFFDGARRDYGPTGIWAPVERSNLLTPELRVVLSPRENTKLMMAWRSVWLASKKDTWTPSGIQDPTGNSGRHVGEQLESRLRWNVRPKSVRVDIGFGYLFDGEFQRSAPGGSGEDSFNVFVEFDWWF